MFILSHCTQNILNLYSVQMQIPPLYFYTVKPGMRKSLPEVWVSEGILSTEMYSGVGRC